MHKSNSTIMAAVLALVIASQTSAEPRAETAHSLRSGVDWLQSEAARNPAWWPREQPAITSLALATMSQSASQKEFSQKGFALLQAHQKKDGGIYHTNYI